MARTWWLFGLGLAHLAFGAVPGCAPEPFTYNDGATSSGAGGGAGGAGGGTVCEPQSMASCYSGPKDTVMIGTCVEGMATCLTDGSGYGPCEGQVVPAFDDCATPLDEDCNSSSPTCTGAHAWSLRWGDALQQRAYSVAVDLEGNSVVTGEFDGDLGVGGLVSMGGTDVFVVKLNPAGNVLWSRGWGDPMTQESFGVAVDEATGDIFVTGGFQGIVNFGTGSLTSAGAFDVFVVKLSASGEVLWSDSFGDAGDQNAHGIAAAGGSVAITGMFQGVMDFGAAGVITSAGMYDGYVAVLDSATGAGIWSKGFGDATTQGGWRVKTGAGGSVYMTGHGSGGINFGDGPKLNVGGTDSYLVKFGANGGVVWSKILGSAGNEQGFGLAVDVAGNVVIGGTTTGTVDFGGGPLAPVGATDMYLAKYTNEGAFVFARLFGTDTTQPNGIATDGAGNILVTGVVSGPIDFGTGVLTGNMDQDVFIAKFNGAGVALWAMNAGTVGGAERGSDIAANALGEVLLSGYFNNAVAFPAAPMLTSAGGYDAFIAKLAP